MIKAWNDLSNYLITTTPDLVQFGKINFPFEAYFLKRIKKKGLVLTQICHEFERRETSGIFSGKIDKLYNSVFQNFWVIFFHAHENKRRFHSIFKYPKNNTYIIPLGNQDIFIKFPAEYKSPNYLAKKYAASEDDIIILFFGVLAPSKGLPILIEAFSKIVKSHSLKLIIAGYPAKHINLISLFNQVKELGLENQVKFDLRYLPNQEVHALFMMADLIVYPYINSTQSSSIQVAYSFGKPVVASNVGGLPEVIDNGKSGLLVEPENSDDLAEKLNRLISDPLLRKEMGVYAKKLSETRFSWTSIAAQILQVYDQLNL